MMISPTCLPHRSNRRRAVTLVELLIVVAIIAVLASLAVVNFMAAQQRSKVARVHNDLRTLATALEAYAVDARSYPGGNAWSAAGHRPSLGPTDPLILERLSTPVAYVAQGIMPAPFAARRFSGPNIIGVGAIDTNVGNWPANAVGGPDGHLFTSYQYTAVAPEPSNRTGLERARIDVIRPERRVAVGYVLQSAGPMEALINLGGVIANGASDYAAGLIYDPTNGTASFGNIYRTGGQPEHRDNLLRLLQANR